MAKKTRQVQNYLTCLVLWSRREDKNTSLVTYNVVFRSGFGQCAHQNGLTCFGSKWYTKIGNKFFNAKNRLRKATKQSLCYEQI